MSSSYDSALVDTATVDDPRLVALPRGVRMLHIEALVWSKVRMTDGFIPATSLLRLTDEPEPEQAAQRLATAGIWEVVQEGWQLVDFEATQMSANRVRQKREDAKKRFDTYQQTHKRVANATANAPARPALPARKGGRQEGGGVAAGQEAAAAAFAERPELSVVPDTTDDTVACSDFRGHQPSHRLLGEEWVCDLCRGIQARRSLAKAIREAPESLRKHHLDAFERRFTGYPAGRERRNRRPMSAAVLNVVRGGA